MATRVLKVTGDLKELAVIGIEFEQQINVRLHLSAFPTLSVVTWVVNSLHDNVINELIADFRTAFPQVVFHLVRVRFTEIEEAAEVLRNADIICTSRALDFMAGDIKAHAHVNLIGTEDPCSLEVGDDFLSRARCVVLDSTPDMVCDAEDLCEDLESIPVDKLYELGRLISISLDGRDIVIDTQTRDEIRGDGDVTIFKSAGFGAGVHDLPLLNAVTKRAILNNRGTLVGDFDA